VTHAVFYSFASATQGFEPSASTMTVPESFGQGSSRRIGMLVDLPLGVALVIVLTIMAWLVVQNWRLKKTVTGTGYANEGSVGIRKTRYVRSPVQELGARPEK
jgi:hypothetical protein